MWSGIVNWFLQNYPFVIIIGVAIWSTWKVSSIFQRFEKCEDELHTLQKDHQEIKPIVFQIQSQLSQLLIYLQSNDSKLKGLIRSKSPMQLTDMGVSLLNYYQCEEFFQNNESILLAQIQDSNPKIGLDVQTKAFDILSSMKDSSAFISIKEAIYEHPVFKDVQAGEIQIDLYNICYLMSIKLRNVYLENNSGSICLPA